MKIASNKQKGNAGLAMAIAYYGCNNYTVSIPLNDTQDYDLIVDDGVELKKVQVKFTSSIRNGSYQLSLKSCGGTKGVTYKTVVNTNVDIVFAVCGDGTLYEIPKNIIKAESAICLRKEPSKFSHTSDIDYSQFIVKI